MKWSWKALGWILIAAVAQSFPADSHANRAAGAVIGGSPKARNALQRLIRDAILGDLRLDPGFRDEKTGRGAVQYAEQWKNQVDFGFKLDLREVISVLGSAGDGTYDAGFKGKALIEQNGVVCAFSLDGSLMKWKWAGKDKSPSITALYGQTPFPIQGHKILNPNCNGRRMAEVVLPLNPGQVAAAPAAPSAGQKASPAEGPSSKGAIQLELPQEQGVEALPRRLERASPKPERPRPAKPPKHVNEPHLLKDQDRIHPPATDGL